MTNAELFEYGIHTELSDVRAHVSVVNRTIYVFPTKAGVQAIEKHKPELRPAYQAGVNGATAEGWLVKWDSISDIRRLRFHSWPGWQSFKVTLTTTQKGVLAVDCVVSSMRMGKFPFWLDASEDERENVQVKGTDIVVFCRKKVQVKCDWKSGEPPLGSGNLFLQKAERNPLKRH
jgi:hypothetical protein